MRRVILVSLSSLGAVVLLLIFAASITLSFDAAGVASKEALQNGPPLVPAFYWGEVLAAPPGFIPTAGVTVTVIIEGYSCGVDGYTYNDGGQVIYGVEVQTGGDCGVPGRTITFWIGTQVMAPTADWPGEGAVVELTLWPANIVYADEAGICGGYAPCFTRIQAAIDDVMIGGSVYVYAGTYTDTMLYKNVLVASLGDIALTSLEIQTGTLVAPSGALSLTGDLVYTAGAFDHNDGAVLFTGSITQTIVGDVAFYDLTVSTGATVTTASDVTVAGTCTREISSTTQETKGVGSTSPILFVLAGATITPTTQGSLSSLQVRRVETNHLNAPGWAQTGRYWTITPDAGGYTATLTLPHNDTPAANDMLCRYTGAAWDCAADSYDPANGTITRRNITQFSPWATGDDVPTAVGLASFTASPKNNAVLLRWETANEMDNVGFHLHRSLSPDGAYVRLNATLIPAQAPGSTFSAAYTWLDQEVEPGIVYYYKLEDLDVHGQHTFHGPVASTTSATPQRRVYLPLVLRDVP